MKTPNVIIHSNAPDEAAAVVRKVHPDLTLFTSDSFAALPAMIEETRAEVVYSVRFDSVTPYPREAVVKNEHVKWLAVGGSGTDHLGQWNPDDVTVTNAAGVAADMMAEYTIGAMLSFSLDFDGFRSAKARREWLPNGRVRPIQGATLLIIGLGHTGRATAQRAKAMGMTVLGVRARPRDTDYADEVYAVEELPTLYPRADYILVCVPRLPSTMGLLDASAFAAMKPGATLIDVSRGGVCDEAALIDALQNGPMAGAALDVFKTEPLPESSAFWGLDNVILTPHCSSVFDGWYRASAQLFADNLSRYRKGEPLQNIVDPARGY